MPDSTTNKQAHSASSGQATSMAELMAKQSSSFVTFKKGDTVKGTVTKLSKHEGLVNLQSKGDAMILEKEPRLMRALLQNVKVGDEVEATVILAESDSGQPIVSLRRFVDNILWKNIEELKKSQEQVSVTINESTKGGYVVTSDSGLNGFIPNSHTTGEALTPGMSIKASIADYNREDRKIIFSQKSTVSLENFEKIAKVLKKGEKVEATILNGTNFGYFAQVTVTVDGKPQTLEGLIHISELSWQKIEEISGMYKAGEKVETIVINLDKDSRRLDLSIKRLSTDPFEKLKEEYPLEKKVQGKVTRIEDGNVTVDLGDGVIGIIRKEKVPPTVRYEVGSTVNATVSSLDSRRRRIELAPILLEKPLMYR